MEEFPQLVESIGNDHLGVAYSRLVPLLMEGMKELKRQNQDLQDRLESLEEKLNNL